MTRNPESTPDPMRRLLSSVAPPDLRARVRRVVDANVREPVSLEIVVDTLAPTQSA